MEKAVHDVGDGDGAGNVESSSMDAKLASGLQQQQPHQAGNDHLFNSCRSDADRSDQKRDDVNMANQSQLASLESLYQTALQWQRYHLDQQNVHAQQSVFIICFRHYCSHWYRQTCKLQGHIIIMRFFVLIFIVIFVVVLCIET
jgi:hypothetical protein